MKKHLIIYALLILIYFAWNQFVKIQDEIVSESIKIFFSSILFLYMAFIAYTILRKTKK